MLLPVRVAAVSGQADLRGLAELAVPPHRAGVAPPGGHVIVLSTRVTRDSVIYTWIVTRAAKRVLNHSKQLCHWDAGLIRIEKNIGP